VEATDNTGMHLFNRCVHGMVQRNAADEYEDSKLCEPDAPLTRGEGLLQGHGHHEEAVALDDRLQRCRILATNLHMMS